MNIAIEQIQHGNEQAFKSLFDEYYQGLCVFASAYLKDDDLSADVVQEAFVKFWNRRRDFDHIVKIKSFLYYCCPLKLFIQNKLELTLLTKYQPF